MQYFKVLPDLILEMQMRLCQEKKVTLFLAAKIWYWIQLYSYVFYREMFL